MSQPDKRPGQKKPVRNKKKPNSIYIAAGVLVVVLIAFVIIKGSAGSNTNTGTTASQGGGDIKITKSEITDKASFIAYKSGNTKMEIIAVRAPDGTIRTALNTCQVCYDSGRGYYVQEGNELVCQNCGNRFKISQIEKEKNGCNPVPILEENKSDDGSVITIAAGVLTQNAEYFSNWKK